MFAVLHRLIITRPASIYAPMSVTGRYTQSQTRLHNSVTELDVACQNALGWGRIAAMLGRSHTLNARPTPVGVAFIHDPKGSGACSYMHVTCPIVDKRRLITGATLRMRTFLRRIWAFDLLQLPARPPGPALISR